MNAGNFAMLASIVASLVAVPVASTNITGEYDTAVGALVREPADQAEDVPRKVTERIGSEGFRKEVETAFGTVRFVSENGEFRTVLENPDYQVESVKKPSEKIQKYRNADLELEIVETSTEIRKVCSTPRGELKTVVDSGDRKTVFDGLGRRSVKQKCETAERKLEEGLEKTAVTARDAGLFSKQVSISELDKDSEYVEISNNGPLPVKINNWTIEDESGKTFKLEGTLEPDETVRVKSGDLYEDCEELCWRNRSVWNSGEDIAVLRDSQGELVDSYSYGG